MTFLRRLASATAIGLLSAGTAWAGGGGGEIPSTLETAAPLIGQHALNLAILLGVLVYFTRKPIQAALAARREEIRKGIEKSGEAERIAKERFDAIEQKLSGFEAELAAMKTDAEAKAKAEHDKLVADARSEAAALKASAARSIRDESDRAVAALRKEAAAQAVSLATEKAAALINDQDHARLDRQFLSVVQGGKPAGVTHG
jgi:F-type H+-transporting ATPase subunit b